MGERLCAGGFGFLKRFSSLHSVTGSMEGGFFLRKKPLSCNSLPLQQLENRYIDPPQNECIVVSHPFRKEREKGGARRRIAFLPDQQVAFRARERESA